MLARVNVAPSASPTAVPVSPEDTSARGRLLRELQRTGPSGRFLRWYFLLQNELGPSDLRTVESAVSQRCFALGHRHV